MAGMAGCSSVSNSGNTSVTISVTWWPSLYTVPPWHVAIENGYFDEAGYDVTITGSQGGGTTVRALTTGDIPIAESAAAAPVKAWLSGAPLNITAFGCQNPGAFVMAVPSDSDIEGPADMVDKSYGFTSPGSSTEAFGKMSIDRADGVEVDDVEWQSMGGSGEIITGMEEGIIDAGGVWDPTLSELLIEESIRPIMWYPEYTVVPDTVMIVGSQFAEENPGTVEDLHGARQKGTEFVRNNPEEAASIYAEGGDLDSNIAQRVIENGMEYDFYSMEVTTEGIEDLGVTVQTMGITDSVPDWSKIFNQEFISEDLRADLP
jgi:ABC-type nitrate/sulfonate/bicarbonate transport system substrate-binding protein